MEKINDVAIAARREYYRQWREKNREKIAEYNLKYWERKAKKMGVYGGLVQNL